MGDHEPRLPMAKAAFDDPATRAGWKATRRRVVLRLWLYSVLLLGALALTGVLAEPYADNGHARGGSGPAGAIGGVAVLAYPFALYTCCGALSRLRRARAVLEAYPWRPLPAVRRLTGTKEAGGVPVQLRLPEGEGEAEGRSGSAGGGENAYVDDDGSVWTQSMSARSPLRWNRWHVALERGAWYAGDLEIGGVLALPGGRGLMTVRRRTQVLSMERRTAKADHASILAAAPGRG